MDYHGMFPMKKWPYLKAGPLFFTPSQIGETRIALHDPQARVDTDFLSFLIVW
jgi:hypothetical protein